MAFQLKYYFQYYPLRATEPNIVELWQNTSEVLVSEEVKTMAQCFMVEMPELDHKFQVVRGRGCTVNLLSDSDRKFFTGIYHVDPQEFMVKHYRSDLGGNPDFYGYLNAEMVTEAYDKEKNYSFSITGNDGFSLMDRFSFLQSDGSMYTGLKSKYELLQIVFGKIALPYDVYRIALATTFTGYSNAANSTILHESYINCANFYDEDNKPMTLREVVESILAPYGAHIFAEEGHIYIRDIHTIASNTSITYKQFNLTTGNYIGDVVVSNEKAVSDIGYMGTGQSIELSGGKNRQVVSYSPYPVKTVLQQTLASIDEFATVPGSFSTKDGYNYRTLDDCESWEIDPIYNLSLNPPTFEESYYTYSNDSNIYLRYPRYGAINQRIAKLTNGKYLTISGAANESGRYMDGLRLRIGGQVLVKTKDNPYTNTRGADISTIIISVIIKIGNKYLKNTTDIGIVEWVDTPVFYDLRIDNNEKIAPYVSSPRIISDSFIEFRQFGEDLISVVLGNTSDQINLNGNIEFEIFSDWYHNTSKNVSLVKNSTIIKEIWLKNISLSLTRIDGSEVSDTDIEFIGLLDKKYQNEAEKIELKCGTDAQFADRGKILKYDGSEYTDIKEWTRASQTYKIEELLLNSLSSNYRAGFIKLYGMKLKAGFKLQNVLTDTFIGSKKLMVNSGNIDYWNNLIECSLIEITPDELTIVKDPTIF